MTRWTLISIVWGSLLRIWILRQIFSKNDKKQIIIISLRSAFYALIAFVIYNIGHFIPVLQGHYWDYLIIITIILIFLIPTLPQGGKSWIIQSLLWIGLKFGLAGSLWTYSLSARWEESLKRNSLKNNTSWLLQSMILGGIVSAIMFGLGENIIYIVTSYLQSHNLQNTLTLLWQRALLPIMVHIGSLCLWFITLLQLKKYSNNTSLLRWIGAIVSIWSHFLYNISKTTPSLKILSLILMGIYLITIHYSLFKSDTLYSQSKTQSQK